MQSLRYHAKGPSIGLVEHTPAVFHLIIHKNFHHIRLPLYRSKDLQEAKLSPSDHKVELAGELEVICPEIQRKVVKGGYSRRKVHHYRFHRRARGVVERPNVLYLNPQASMAEVLAKTEKYINGEEALLSKKKSSSTQKEKSRGDKKRERRPKRQADKDRSPRRNRENREQSPRRRGNFRDRLRPPQLEL